ncbi:hypothetical protein S40288_06462 [Stachybotrys chartarum IBT 40288]|nr:hypothetical protein S40288_06462 [Stachybotrys chartarum IBT 40288]
MPRWPIRPRTGSWPSSRRYSSYHESVDVPCGSAGRVTIDLYNISKHSPSSALIVHLPAFPAVRPKTPLPLPSFLQQWPVASINYRWSNQPEPRQADFSPSLAWPTPVHDVGFAFSWLKENLTPDDGRRSVYAYGSHLGASLAVSLALTEAHSHARFGVKGVLAYNGVYNWTMFLPDHRINKSARMTKTAARPRTDSQMQMLTEQIPTLFHVPSRMFDPFASPSLLFHSPGLEVPKTFGLSATESRMIDALANRTFDAQVIVKPPRKAHMVFPPRQSTLKIPDACLLYTTPPPILTAKGEPTKRRVSSRGNTLEAQAQELAELMRRSIDKVELKERSKWDDDLDTWARQQQRRVQTMAVGEERSILELGDVGKAVAMAWLGERMCSPKTSV